MDLRDLEGVYRDGDQRPLTRGQPRPLRRRRVSVVALAGVCVAVAVVVREATPLGGALDALLLGILAYLLASPVWRPWAVRLGADELVVRSGLRSGRAVPWSRVQRIRVQARWDLHSAAVLDDDTELPLPGLPLEQAERLRQAVALARGQDPDAPETGALRRRPTPPAPSPGTGNDGGPPDEGLQGPFRTGPLRR